MEKKIIWSGHQTKIFEKVVETQSNVCVQASPGSGKTTTAVECLSRINPKLKVILLSFSNAIVKELKERITETDLKQVSTLHSKGFKFLRENFGNLRLNDKKFFGRVEKLLPPAKTKKDFKQNFKICYQTVEVINFARMTMTDWNRNSLSRMCLKFSLDFDDSILDYSLRLLKESVKEKKIKEIDFTDMIFLPVYLKLVNETFDLVFLDEAQDVNQCQKMLVEMMLGQKGRLISFGDIYQSLYGFAGSTPEAFRSLMQRPNTINLTLPVSRRCPRAIVKHAKQYCNLIESWEGAEEGYIGEGTIFDSQPEDFILSRTTKPLIECFFQLLKKGILSKVIGKDFEKSITTFAEKVSGNTILAINKACEREMDEMEKKLIAEGAYSFQKHPKYVRLLEKVEVIETILENCNSAAEFLPTVSKIFDERTKGVSMMTIHRSKGLEADRIFIIETFDGEELMPHKLAETELEFEQENNLIFVAWTRAKKEVYQVYLESRKMKLQNS